MLEALLKVVGECCREEFSTDLGYYVDDTCFAIETVG